MYLLSPISPTIPLEILQNQKMCKAEKKLRVDLSGISQIMNILAQHKQILLYSYAWSITFWYIFNKLICFIKIH